MYKLLLAAVIVILSLATSTQAALPLNQLKLPPGFAIDIYADNVPNARSLALGKNGTVLDRKSVV